MRLGWLCTLLLLGCAVEHIGLLPSDAPDAATDSSLARDDVGSDGGRAFDAGPALDAAPLVFDVGTDTGARDAGGMDAGVDSGPMDAGPRDVGVDAGPPRDVGVDADPCTTGPDSDMDGVSDACDRCAGEDDRVDVDGDGIPDACDPWPCMNVPTPPGTVQGEHIEFSNVRLGDGTNRSVANAGDSIRLRFNFELSDASCVGCPTQVEIGSQRTGRIGCIYDGVPPPGGVRASFDRVLTVGGPGVIELRFNLGLDTACERTNAWWPTAPGPNQTFALICVR